MYRFMKIVMGGFGPSILAVSITTTAIAPPPTPRPQQARPQEQSKEVVSLKKRQGIFVVPALINGAIILDVTVDSGAADVSIPVDVVLTLMRTGTITSSDFLGSQTYVLADGTKVPSETFRIRSIRVGERVVADVVGSVAPVQASLLLGQSFLDRFRSWSIDNASHSLVLEW